MILGCALCYGNVNAMRIACLCCDRAVPYGGRKGASIHLAEMSRGLAAEGAQVLVLAAAIEGDPAPPPGVTVECLPAAAERKAWLAERLRDFEAAVLYERLSLHSTAGADAADALGIAHLVELNAPLLDEAAADGTLAEPNVAERCERRTLAAADLVLAVSPPLAAYAYARGARAVEVMPNATAVERFPAPLRDGDRPVAAFAGAVRARHGSETIAAAWRELGPDAPQLLVVGDGPGREVLEDAGAHVTGLLPPSAARAALAGADIGLAPYAAGGPDYFSPLKLFDYMAAGLAVVAADLPGIASIVDPRMAVLIPPGDPAALAEAVRALADDAERRARMGRAGRSLVAARHTWGHRARRVIAAAAVPRLRMAA